MQHKVRVSSKGQIVIPEELRKRYDITQGTELILEPVDERKMIVERVPKLSELFGFLGQAKTATLLAKEREKELKIERERDEELRHRRQR